MSKIIIEEELYIPCRPDSYTTIMHSYVNSTGLTRLERKTIVREGDFSNESFERVSNDNGKTWHRWENVQKSMYAKTGTHELNINGPTAEKYNPVYDHAVFLTMQRIFKNGHKSALGKYWNGKREIYDHTFLNIKDRHGDVIQNLVKYEQGSNFDEDNWMKPEYTKNNVCYFGNNIVVLENGEILFAIAPALLSCSRILDVDINSFFPSCPDVNNGLIIVRGTWDKDTETYHMTFSKPIVINDLKSSRAVAEPLVIALKSGRIVAIFRGSNVKSEKWNTRIEDGTPTHKWYTYSDDGGKTFTDPVPWHFDNREVFYSSATLSNVFTSPKNGKQYWIGNATSPESYGNYPRYPLVIAEIDEKSGLLKKDTLTVITTRDIKAESDKVNLICRDVFIDRETGDAEIYVSRCGFDESKEHTGPTMRYVIKIE